MSIRTFSQLMCVVALCATWTTAQESRRRLGEKPDPNMQGTFYASGTPWPHPNTFTELCRLSDAIIDGTVMSSLAASRSSPDIPYALETDVVIKVNQVVKGPRDFNTFMVAQNGGVQGGVRLIKTDDVLMLPRERYVLFLLKEARTTLPVVAGVPRYAVIAGPEGKFLVEGGTIQIITKAPSNIQSQYKASTVESFENAIAAVLGN